MDRVAQRQDVIFIGTANDLSKLPDQLKSRFGEPIEIPLPDKKQRKEVIQHYLPKNEKYEKFIPYLVNQTRNRSIRDIKKLINEAIANARFRQFPVISLKPEDFAFDNFANWLFHVEFKIEYRGFATEDSISLEDRKKIILYYLPPNHQSTNEFIHQLALYTEGKSSEVIREMCYIALSNAYFREIDKLELTYNDFNDTVLKYWYGWYHPYAWTQAVKPHLKPFFKEVLPVLLQATSIGINLWYSHQNACRAEIGLALNRLSSSMHQEGLFLQKATAAISLKEALARPRGTVDWEYSDRYKIIETDKPGGLMWSPKRTATFKDLAEFTENSLKGENAWLD